MYADALRARRQVLLGNEQVEEKGQDQGAVAEIVFCGAVRSHSGEPSLCHWNRNFSVAFCYFFHKKDA